MERLLQYCSEETGYKQQEVETIIGCFLDKISQELSEGHTVDLGACFGIFSVKLRTGALRRGRREHRRTAGTGLFSGKATTCGND